MAAKRIPTKAALRRLVGDKEFGVTYRKANGQLRKATAQLGVTHNSRGRRLVNGTLDDGVRDLENAQGVVRYFDVGKDDYRKFSLDKMVTLTVRGKKFSFGM